MDHLIPALVQPVEPLNLKTAVRLAMEDAAVAATEKVRHNWKLIVSVVRGDANKRTFKGSSSFVSTCCQNALRCPSRFYICTRTATYTTTKWKAGETILLPYFQDIRLIVWFRFCKNSRPPPTWSQTILVLKIKRKTNQQGAHARFDPGTLKPLQKLSFPPPARLTSHPKCDQNGNKKRFALSNRCQRTFSQEV